MKNNEQVLEYMFRYLEKFTGQYRVLPEFVDDIPRDEEGEIDESFEDLYIPCRKGVIKHTYIDNDILAICFYDKASACKNTFKELKDKYPDLEKKYVQVSANMSQYQGNIQLGFLTFVRESSAANKRTANKTYQTIYNRTIKQGSPILVNFTEAFLKSAESTMNAKYIK